MLHQSARASDAWWRAGRERKDRDASHATVTLPMRPFGARGGDGAMWEIRDVTCLAPCGVHVAFIEFVMTMVHGKG